MAAETKTLQLEKKVFITGKITIKTGLHIGGSSLGLQIGGADKVVVRNPISNLPYIPGSSLKGKMRSLLEKSLGLVEITNKTENGKKVWKGDICKNPVKDVVQLFGYPADTDTDTEECHYAPTRLTVRDCDLTEKSISTLAAAEDTDMYCTEVKTEVNIDRLTSAANPRNFERVPAGAEFRLDMVLDIYNVDTEKRNGDESTRDRSFVSLIRQGLMLLEDDSLGGHGTRGYGQVEFHIDSVSERTAEQYRTDKMEKVESIFKDTFTMFMNR